MLIVLGGPPGVGKTATARQIVARLPSAYLRIDTIERASRKVASAVFFGRRLCPSSLSAFQVASRKIFCTGRPSRRRPAQPWRTKVLFYSTWQRALSPCRARLLKALAGAAQPLAMM
ncbi:AAA family ATPase [Variovorax sp. LT1R16]|uniref:AAA family ATPase n=1 Tax=Variovorax sp. LT1R16 TaxID=3443728 RepID=UPI003F46767E